MTNQIQHPKMRTLLTCIVLVPIFFVFSLLFSNWRQGREMDFGIYWQAGRMVLSGQDVYDREQWEAVRQVEGIVDYPAGVFPYPLPLAILFSALGLLPLQLSYTIWMFLAQIAVLVSILVLLGFYPARSGYLELLAVAGIFFFRPMFSLINSGQVLSFLLLALVGSIRAFQDGRWFVGGFILSVLSLKPSIGFPLFLFTGIWLVLRKQWKGIWGMLAGGFALLLLGALVNYRWVIDFLHTSDDSFRRFLGMQPMLWGIVDHIFKTDNVSLTIGFICAAAVLALETYLLWKDKPGTEPFEAFTTIVPATLIVAPYLWNYDQILLMIPILYLLIAISKKYGDLKAALFMFGVVALAFGMVMVAYWLQHDVWSFMNTFVIWVLSLYFFTRGRRREDNQAGLAPVAKIV